MLYTTTNHRKYTISVQHNQIDDTLHKSRVHDKNHRKYTISVQPYQIDGILHKSRVHDKNHRR